MSSLCISPASTVKTGAVNLAGMVGGLLDCTSCYNGGDRTDVGCSRDIARWVEFVGDEEVRPN